MAGSLGLLGCWAFLGGRRHSALRLLRPPIEVILSVCHCVRVYLGVWKSFIAFGAGAVSVCISPFLIDLVVRFHEKSEECHQLRKLWIS